MFFLIDIFPMAPTVSTLNTFAHLFRRPGACHRLVFELFCDAYIHVDFTQNILNVFQELHAKRKQ